MASSASRNMRTVPSPAGTTRSGPAASGPPTGVMRRSRLDCEAPSASGRRRSEPSRPRNQAEPPEERGGPGGRARPEAGRPEPAAVGGEGVTPPAGVGHEGVIGHHDRAGRAGGLPAASSPAGRGRARPASGPGRRPCTRTTAAGRGRVGGDRLSSFDLGRHDQPGRADRRPTSRRMVAVGVGQRDRVAFEGHRRPPADRPATGRTAGRRGRPPRSRSSGRSGRPGRRRPGSGGPCPGPARGAAERRGQLDRPERRPGPTRTRTPSTAPARGRPPSPRRPPAAAAAVGGSRNAPGPGQGLLDEAARPGARRGRSRRGRPSAPRVGQGVARWSRPTARPARPSPGRSASGPGPRPASTPQSDDPGAVGVPAGSGRQARSNACGGRQRPGRPRRGSRPARACPRSRSSSNRPDRRRGEPEVALGPGPGEARALRARSPGAIRAIGVNGALAS